MVPTRSIADKLLVKVGVLRARWPPLLWGLGLWSLVVALPYLWLYPGENLARFVCVVLALLAPAALLLVGALARTHLILGAGLVGLGPVLVACPELIGPRITGGLQGLAVAVVLMGFVISVIDASAGPRWRVRRAQRLHRLWRWPVEWGERLVVGLGGIWLIMAWVAEIPTGVADGQRVRATRVIAAALLWIALRLFPLTRTSVRVMRAGPARLVPWVALISRRSLWLAMIVGVWIWWWV